MRALVAGCLFVLCALRAALAAEPTTGTVVGSLVDRRGSPVANARVFAAAPSGRYAAASDARGRFALLGMIPDTYTLSVQARGFEPATSPGIVVLAGETQRVNFELVPQLKTIASTHARNPAFSVGSTGDVFTVSGHSLTPPVTSSGLGNYSAGTVQGAIAAVPGVVSDPFANAILRGGKVDDTVFDFDSVPVPQGLIAEPGGNVVGAQLPMTGIASTTVTLAGYETQGDNALGGVVDEIPATGTYPGSTTLEVADGVSSTRMQFANVQVLGAAPDQRLRYALATTSASETFAYGDGHTFYPAEAATYGLGLESRSQYAIESNVHYRLTSGDDLSLLGFAGQAAYDEYATPYAGERFGAFDGATLSYPGERSPSAAVTFASGIRGSFGIVKAAWLRSAGRSLSRVQLYQSRFAASAGGPYWDENGFPNGTFSFFGRQSGREEAIVYDGDTLLGDRHHLRYGAEYRITHYTLDQLVPTFDEIVRSNPLLHSYLAYAGDTWSPSARFDVMGALRLAGTRFAPSTGYPYSVGALDPHAAASYRLGTTYALRATFDHTTVAPKPLEADRYDSANVDKNGDTAPFVTLVPETANVYTASLEGAGRTQFRLTYWAELERNRIDVLPFNYRQSGGELAPSPIGMPANAGRLDAHGMELWLRRGGFTLDADYIRAFSSSASEFAYNNLNAPAIAAGHLFPVGYVPDLSATLSYEIHAGARVRVTPYLSYETGYPYGIGKKAWIFDPATGEPVQVLNDNNVNPGANYYFLRDPSRPFDAVSNPYIGNLGTPEGDDPNTLRSPPQTLVNLHVEADVAPQVTAIVDVANLFGNASATAYGQNGYLIGPPGYAGGDPLYGTYYERVMGTSQPYLLGNGVPTNDGVTQSVPWTYGRSGYIPYSYPMARSVALRLRVRL
ncbi:MAG TPA: TonB-dependent receptor [Candidatus Baltobacteraceae bacterium]|nr:TonB-dependent receptor [Candidatus Baltobacteraceae bacterium]